MLRRGLFLETWFLLFLSSIFSDVVKYVLGCLLRPGSGFRVAAKVNFCVHAYAVSHGTLSTSGLPSLVLLRRKSRPGVAVIVM